MRAALGDIASRLFLGDIPRKTTLAGDCDRLALVAGNTLDAVGVSGGIGESSVEITLLEVKNTLFTVRHVLCKKVVEVVGLESQEDATTISDTGGQDQVKQESTESAALGRRRLR